MVVLIERANSGRVEVDGETISTIGKGIVAFVGIEKGDEQVNLERVCERILNMRIFPDKAGKMNKSLNDINGDILMVSNFTLCGDTRKGTRPSYSNAMDPNSARKIFQKLVETIKRKYDSGKVEQGKFGAMMNVMVENDGPVNLILQFR